MEKFSLNFFLSTLENFDEKPRRLLKPLLVVSKTYFLCPSFRVMTQWSVDVLVCMIIVQFTCFQVPIAGRQNLHPSETEFLRSFV